MKKRILLLLLSLLTFVAFSACDDNESTPEETNDDGTVITDMTMPGEVIVTNPYASSPY